ncbi:amino acid adenylation domain-containing protein [Chitinophaga pendula]|uniref:non-ribosomal peptide synthetase n=1 Tax=Chitinophaga TaxID=79328 RepID=UPI000BB092BF|nr:MULTISPECIES: non-ribosomal peptide synthetase [Chitinophaga]ASZ13674.1 hypothetical protein CK934_23320 [Chitinophaga sp. MD30]UCJ08709.1 amino acid adenylation domain-containing protein [Chitinophaga pendula]
MLDLTSLKNNQKVLEREYWEKTLKGIRFENPLKDYTITTDMAYQAVMDSYCIVFPAELQQSLSKIASNTKAAHILLLTALGIHIQKYTSTQSVCVFTPVYKDASQHGQVENEVIPVVVRPFKGYSFRDLLGHVKQEFIQGSNYSSYPLHYMLGIDPIVIQRQPVVGCCMKELHCITQFEPLLVDLLFVFSLEDTPTLTVQYNTDKFTAGYVQRLGDAFCALTGSLMQEAAVDIAQLDLFKNAPERQLLQQFNNNVVSWPEDATVVELFEKQVDKTPDDIALICGESILSYRELDQRSNQWAYYLTGHGVGAGQLVPLFMDRSLEMVIAILAIFKLRAAYVPIDTNFPEDRVQYMLSDTDAKVLITQLRFKNILKNIVGVDILMMDEQEQYWSALGKDRITVKPATNELVYMIYTSGSTGKPKGVLIENAGMLNHLYAKINDLELDHTSQVAQTASYTFDISVWQMFSALLVGGKTVIYTDDLIFSPLQLLRTIDRDEVTIWECVPSYLATVLALDAKLPAFSYLRKILVTGEAVSLGILERWFSVYPGKCVVNAYGPTEASDDICHYAMEQVPVYNHVPIGRPVQNMKIYVVDDNGQLSPIGVKGELCVSGVGVGRGYWKDPVKTDRSFVINPFETDEGYRMYKTGDYAYWLPDGNIAFLGRIDEQVKIHGYRIELQEIENVLTQQPGVRQGVVMAREDENGNKRLVGYVVLEEGVDREDISRALSLQLPEYMLPRHWVELSELPVTTNGKIDKKALPDVSIAAAVIYNAPSGESEEKMVEVWAEVLGVGKHLIGVNRNFFELGGNSLKILQLITILNEEFGYKLVITDIFSNPTITSLLNFLENNNNETESYKEEVAEELSGMQDLFNQLD